MTITEPLTLPGALPEPDCQPSPTARRKYGFLYVKIFVSIIIYCLSVSAVPIYNKMVFASGVGAASGGLHKFPYPVATAFLQLSLVAVVLGVVNIAGHFCCPQGYNHSWLLGPHFRYKIRHVAPVGILFGLKYGVTNWGLQLVPTGMHLLLQSSDLLWTVVLARIVNKERLGILETLAAFLCSLGSMMIGAHAVQSLDEPFIPLLVNLMTPFVLALCISTLRTGTVELFRPDNPLEGTVSPIEFTALKLGLSASMAFLLSMALENGRVQLPRGGEAGHLDAPIRPPWWLALGHESLEGVLLLLLGSIFVLVFQVNLTWLAGLTSAVTVGIVGGIKVVPQWLLNAAFNFSVDLSPLNIAGATLVMGSAALYAGSVSSSYSLHISSAGLRWELREEDSDFEEEYYQPLVKTPVEPRRKASSVFIPARSLLEGALVTPGPTNPVARDRVVRSNSAVAIPTSEPCKPEPRRSMFSRLRSGSDTAAEGFRADSGRKLSVP